MNYFIKVILCQCVLISSIFVTNMKAQEFQKLLFVEDKDTLPYNLLEPIAYKKYLSENPDDLIGTVSYPLIIFFHGSGERGNDNKIQVKHIKDLFLNSSNIKNYPAFVIAPQCPENKRWVESSWTVSKHVMPTKISDPLKLTVTLIEELKEKYPIDQTRIYVVGLSMGGFAVWDIMCRYPGKFAAAVPICGGGDIAKAGLLKDIPIWAFHGSNDKVVKVTLTRNMINAIKASGGKPKYTEYQGIGHDCWIKALKEKGLLEWLFNQKLNSSIAPNN